MEKTKVLALPKVKIGALIQFIALVGIATAAPFFLSQAITGPIVNATLFIAVVLLGSGSAILVGLIPSLVSLSAGLLPAVLAPMIPFIMVGNTVLILIFAALRKKNYWAGMISASALKALWLFATSSVVINLLLKKEIASQVALMMSWPQLLTALAGGVLAFIFLKFLKKV